MEEKYVLKQYDLQSLGSEGVIFHVDGDGVVDFKNAYHLNETAMIIFKTVEKCPSAFRLNDVSRTLAEKFGIDESVALNDAKTVVEPLLERGILEAIKEQV